MSKDTVGKRRGLIVNGFGIGLLIVGMGLLSDGLLDTNAAASEPALSVERKLNLISWLSREDYDCENKTVIEEVKNQIACTTLFNCNAYGFGNLNEVVVAGPSGIISKVEAFRQRTTESAVKQMRSPSENEVRWTTQLVARTANDHRGVLMSFPGLFKNIRSFTDDFNPNISKYSCRIEFQYNPSIVIPWWSMKYRLEAMQDATTILVAGEEFKKNPNSDYISEMVETALQVNGIPEKARRVTTSTAKFSVQPSKNTAFVVEVIKITLPGE
jgi:hypothetical protein